jgi:hypothetical protein
MTFVNKAAAADITVMSHKFLNRSTQRLRLRKVVNGTVVIETTAGDKISLGLLKRTRHDP